MNYGEKYMDILLWAVVGVVVNLVVGAGVWASIDDKEQRLLYWYTDCPPQIGWLVQPIALTAWPVGLWFWWRMRNGG